MGLPESIGLNTPSYYLPHIQDDYDILIFVTEFYGSKIITEDAIRQSSSSSMI